MPEAGILEDKRQPGGFAATVNRKMKQIRVLLIEDHFLAPDGSCIPSLSGHPAKS